MEKFKYFKTIALKNDPIGPETKNLYIYILFEDTQNVTCLCGKSEM